MLIMDKLNFDDLNSLLKNNICEVTFTKINGDIRVMPCTLMESQLPAITEKTIDVTKAVNQEVISVWCLDKKQWRSFRVANVQKVEIIHE